MVAVSAAPESTAPSSLSRPCKAGSSLSSASSLPTTHEQQRAQSESQKMKMQQQQSQRRSVGSSPQRQNQRQRVPLFRARTCLCGRGEECRIISTCFSFLFGNDVRSQYVALPKYGNDDNNNGSSSLSRQLRDAYLRHLCPEEKENGFQNTVLSGISSHNKEYFIAAHHFHPAVLRKHCYFPQQPSRNAAGSLLKPPAVVSKATALRLGLHVTEQDKVSTTTTSNDNDSNYHTVNQTDDTSSYLFVPNYDFDQCKRDLQDLVRIERGQQSKGTEIKIESAPETITISQRPPPQKSNSAQQPSPSTTVSTHSLSPPPSTNTTTPNTSSSAVLAAASPSSTSAPTGTSDHDHTNDSRKGKGHRWKRRQQLSFQRILQRSVVTFFKPKEEHQQDDDGAFPKHRDEKGEENRLQLAEQQQQGMTTSYDFCDEIIIDGGGDDKVSPLKSPQRSRYRNLSTSHPFSTPPAPSASHRQKQQQQHNNSAPHTYPRMKKKVSTPPPPPRPPKPRGSPISPYRAPLKPEKNLPSPPALLRERQHWFLRAMSHEDPLTTSISDTNTPSGQVASSSSPNKASLPLSSSLTWSNSWTDAYQGDEDDDASLCLELSSDGSDAYFSPSRSPLSSSSPSAMSQSKQPPASSSGVPLSFLWDDDEEKESSHVLLELSDNDSSDADEILQLARHSGGIHSSFSACSDSQEVV